MIKLHTNLGVIGIELDYDNAPITAANFEQYVKEGFYDGVVFHRGAWTLICTKKKPVHPFKTKPSMA